MTRAQEGSVLSGQCAGWVVVFTGDHYHVDDRTTGVSDCLKKNTVLELDLKTEPADSPLSSDALIREVRVYAGNFYRIGAAATWAPGVAVLPDADLSEPRGSTQYETFRNALLEVVVSGGAVFALHAETGFKPLYAKSDEFRSVILAEYHHMHDDAIWSRFCQFCLAVRDGKEGDDLASKQRALLQAARSVGAISPTTSIKHVIIERLAPIDIDIQGWMESGYKDSYRSELESVYGQQQAVAVLAKLRELVYQDEDARECLHSLYTRLRTARLEQIWLRLCDLLPAKDGVEKAGDTKDGNGSAIEDKSQSRDDQTSYARALDVMRLLDHGEFGKLEKLLVDPKRSSETNPFRLWFVRLTDVLDDFRSAAMTEGRRKD